MPGASPQPAAVVVHQQEKFETEGEVNVRKRITSSDRVDFVIRFELREEEDQPITEIQT